MQLRLSGLKITSPVFCLLAVLTCQLAQGQMYLNEVYLDPPGSSGDLIYEYIELRGLPNASLADHYLIVLENESTGTANPGQIEAVFDLGSLGVTLGANGFLTLRQADPTNGYGSHIAFDPLSTNLANTASATTWGSGALSSVGFTDEGNNGVLENSGGTFMLIKNNGGTTKAPKVVSPTLIDLDADNNNLLDAGGIHESWTVLDSIGIASEASEDTSRLYAAINFRPGTTGGAGNVPPGAMMVDVGFEIEYFARWGDSTGATAADWHISNLTNDTGSGYDGPVDFRLSGDDPHQLFRLDQFVETTQGVPYGTILLDSFGGTNLSLVDGDFDAIYDGEQYQFDGDVDGADFLAWQRKSGFGLDGTGTPRFATRKDGDANNDRTVDGTDLAMWSTNYGTGSIPLTSTVAAVPEPTGLFLMIAAAAGLVSGRRR
jgi:hypothetical protein